MTHKELLKVRFMYSPIFAQRLWEILHIYLKEIKREFPQIKPFETMTWIGTNQATGFLKEEDYDEV